MKKTFQLFISNLVFVMLLSLFQMPVFAASFSVSKSASSVSPGGQFTVSVNCPSGAGRFSVSASNGSVSSSSLWIDNGSSSVTVTAGRSGTTSVTVTAVDVTGNDESPITGSRSVSVSISTPSSGSNNNSSSNNNTSNSNNSTNSSTNKNNSTSSSTQKTEETKSSVNTLSSLTISTGELNPAFNSNTTSYEVNVDAKTTTITIDAKATDTKATVTGTGEKSLEVGTNSFQVICTAENGSQKIYLVTVNVDETPLVYVDYNNEELGVVRNLKDLAIPASFEETKIKIDDQELTAYHSNNMNKTIVYLINEKGEKNFYLYDEKEGVTSIFIPVSILGRNLYKIDVKKDDVKIEDVKFHNMTIDNNTLKAWTFKDNNNYSLIMLMNDKGEKVLYQYESSENTLQLYHQQKEEENDNTKTYIFMLTTALFALTTICSFIYLYFFKKKSIVAIKAYYERRANK